MPSAGRSQSWWPLRPGRRFGDLRLRPKLIVLHNLFFLVLSAVVYFSLIPTVESQARTARVREETLIARLFATGTEIPAGLRDRHELLETAAPGLGIPAETLAWLDAHPGEVLDRFGPPRRLFRKEPQRASYTVLSFVEGTEEEAVRQAKTLLFLALAGVYFLAVAVLELVIMPHYVYGPIRVTLRADEAARRDDSNGELIAEDLIPGDEIGDIMNSRNRTVTQVRRQRERLEHALSELEGLNRDLQRKNEMLAKARDTMAAQDRLVSLGLVSASVAHEINTPLAVLHGSIEHLREKALDAATERSLERMQRMTERLRQISLTLLDFSRPRHDRTEPVPLRRLVKEAWSLVGFDERAATVTFRNDVEIEARAAGNYDRLMQVFINLLRNALYAVERNGEIVVQSQRLDDNGRKAVVIRVEDNGPGIPEDVLPNIFEAFVTSRLDSKGTGLGLTVARGIVTQFGGEITAINRGEGGACLEVRLPDAQPTVHNGQG